MYAIHLSSVTYSPLYGYVHNICDAETIVFGNTKTLIYEMVGIHNDGLVHKTTKYMVKTGIRATSFEILTYAYLDKIPHIQ